MSDSPAAAALREPVSPGSPGASTTVLTRGPAHAGALRGHLPALDGVRGLAILMVLVLHFVGGMEPISALERRISWVASYGAFGVELFFVLSGFLITGILLDARSKPGYFRNFYMRRVLRIFPLYYFVLAALFLVAPLLPPLRGAHLDFLRQHQAWAWLYGVNVYIAIHGEWALSYIDHFWSLCVEEHFYFFWPLLVWLLGAHPRRLLWTSLALSLGAMAARIVGNVAGLPWWTTYVLTPFRLDGLALGGFLAVLVRQPGGLELVRRNLGRVAGVVGLLVAATFAWVLLGHWGSAFLYPFRSSVITLLLAALLLWALVSPEGSAVKRFFCRREMKFLGTYSYGIYVYHHFISYYLMSHRTEFVVAGWLGSHLAAVLLQGAAGVLVALAVAYVSYELFEKRFLGLKRFFEWRGEGRRP